MLPSLADIREIFKKLRASSSMRNLRMELDSVIRLRLMTYSGKGRVACSRNSHKRIGEIRKLVTYFYQLREIACSPDSDLP